MAAGLDQFARDGVGLLCALVALDRRLTLAGTLEDGARLGNIGTRRTLLKIAFYPQRRQLLGHGHVGELPVRLRRRVLSGRHA